MKAKMRTLEIGGIVDQARSRDESTREKSQSRQTRGVSKGRYSFSAQADSRETDSEGHRTKLACYHCGGLHKLQEYALFQGGPGEEQLKFFRERKLCENCFSPTHYANGCKGSKECKLQECKIRRKHRQSLHEALWAVITKGQERATGSSLSAAAPSFALGEVPTIVQNGFTGNSSEAWSEKKALPIVPVKVKARGRNKVVMSGDEW